MKVAFSGRRPYAPAVLGAILCITPAFARALSVESAAARATFLDSGQYRLYSLDAQWTLDGELGEKPSSITSTWGADALGAWREVDARTGAEVAAIRVYQDEPVVLFRDERIRASRNRHVFPDFHALPPGLMELGYGVSTFAKYQFGRLGTQGPWVLFDTGRKAMVLSPADHFLAAGMTREPGDADAGGINPAITSLPAGFRHATLLVLGVGIRATLDAWGGALQVLNGKRSVPDDADVLLSKFGYWTDNGSSYYYKPVPGLGYEGTLLAVRDAYRKLGVPIAYMQLDSWWYPKEKGNSLAAMAVNGETVYRADPRIFARGLQAFHQEMGLPFIVHARWVAADSPYRREYTMSRNVVLSPAFWKSTASYLHDGGVAVYEQDWLDDNARPATNWVDPQQFLGNMSDAMKQQGIDIQYCMPLPAYFLASTRYQNVETIRVSGDRFQPRHWTEFLYGSALAHAVGLWPWSDVFTSRELPQLILSTLSGGPVGVGDALGRIDASNLRRAMRTDSVLLKPDAPLEPVDASFLSDAQGSSTPMLAATHSGSELEVFAYPRTARDRQLTVPLQELGISGPAYEWDWVRQVGRRIAAGGSFAMDFQGGWSYAVVAPVGQDGIGLIGDTSKIVPLAGERFRIVPGSESTHVTIRYAPQENAVTLTGYAAKLPTLRMLSGSVDSLHYVPATQLFSVTVRPAAGETGTRTAELVIRE